jgi:hypothetical protein
MKYCPLWLSSSLSVLALARCGGTPPARAPEAEPSAPPAAESSQGASGAPGEEPSADPPKEPKRPEPELVKKALDRTGESSATSDTHGLRFEVVEHGPRASWGMALVNRGTETLRVVHDPSLLTIEVVPPADPKAKFPKKPKPRVCTLPPGLRAERASGELSVVLAPGEGVVEAFDPRFYCLPEGGVSPFVAGAEVRARFGFPPKTKVVWKGGRHEEPLPDQPPPFVAVVIPPRPSDVDAGGPKAEEADGGIEMHDDEAPGEAERGRGERGRGEHGRGDHGKGEHGRGERGRGERGRGDHGKGEHGHGDHDHAEHGSGRRHEYGSERPEDEEPTSGVKQLSATPLVLGGDYAPPPPEVPPPTLGLELVQGSDAASYSNATATVRLVNHAKTLRRIYFRRELVSFQVTGPDGTVTCDPQPDERAPDRIAYTALNPGGSIAVTSRLAELCPGDSFQRPGLYVIEAQVDAFASGKEHGFDAFVGKLVSPRAVVVRIRSGTLPFPGPRVLQRVRVGAP